MKQPRKCEQCLTAMTGATCQVCGWESVLVTNAVRNFERARAAFGPAELVAAFHGTYVPDETGFDD